MFAARILQSTYTKVKRGDVMKVAIGVMSVSLLSSSLNVSLVQI